jgi:hypothetical protein
MKPKVVCIQCGYDIDLQKDSFERLTSVNSHPPKYACAKCMKKPLLVYAFNNTKKVRNKRKTELEKSERRLSWNRFPRGAEVREVRLGVDVDAWLNGVEVLETKP